MKKVFICSPLRGNIEENISRAKKYCREAVLKGFVPLAPHVYFTQFLDDNIEAERECGMNCGIQLLKMCDEMWVYTTCEISAGMQNEIKCAEANGIPIKYIE